MTFEELIDEVCAAVPINDRVKAGAAVNRAANFISMTIPFNVTISTETFATSKEAYTFGADFGITDFGRMLSVNRLDSIRSPILEAKDPETIIGMNASNTTGLLQAYSIEGTGRIRFYPWPEVGSGVVFVYAPKGADMSADSDTPSGIEEEFHDAIVYYASSKLALREDVNKVRAFKELFNEEMAEYRKWMRTRQGGAYSSLEVGYPGRSLFYTHRNDTYP
jgi:hypothetical protein